MKPSEAQIEAAFAACRSIRFAVDQAARHGGDFSLNDLLAADLLAREALAPPVQETDRDVDRLICGNIEDLKCSLGHGVRDRALLERALAACTGRERKTKRHMLEVALRKLRAKEDAS